MVLRFGQLFGQKLQTVAHFVGKHEKSSIWPNLATFWHKLSWFCVWATFRPKVAETGLFREKARKIIDLAKTVNVWQKVSLFWRFDQLFGQTLQKVAHFVKKHEKSSIWPKLLTFRTNCHGLGFWATFRQKVAHVMKKHEK